MGLYDFEFENHDIFCRNPLADQPWFKPQDDDLPIIQNPHINPALLDPKKIGLRYPKGVKMPLLNMSKASTIKTIGSFKASAATFPKRRSSAGIQHQPMISVAFTLFMLNFQR